MRNKPFINVQNIIKSLNIFKQIEILQSPSKHRPIYTRRISNGRINVIPDFRAITFYEIKSNIRSRVISFDIVIISQIITINVIIFMFQVSPVGT